MSAIATDPQEPRFPVIREAVAAFAGKTELRDAVARLLADGFKPADLSVLATRDSLEVAGNVPGYRGTPGGMLLSGLTDEVNFLGPLTVAGIVMLSGGPVAAAIGALVAAGLGGAAVEELLVRYAANQHSAEFAAALQSGAVLLWARVDDPELEATAVRILEEAGGRHAHMHAPHRQAGGSRPVSSAPSMPPYPVHMGNTARSARASAPRSLMFLICSKIAATLARR